MARTRRRRQAEVDPLLERIQRLEDDNARMRRQLDALPHRARWRFVEDLNGDVRLRNIQTATDGPVIGST